MGILNRIPLLRKVLEVGYTTLIIILLSVIVGLILALPVMWLWNFTFGKFWPNMHINVFQAWALNILTAILFSRTSDSNKK